MNEFTVIEMNEFTVGWGEDTCCGICLSPLPAGSPAWTAGGSQPLCADCAADEETVIARKEPAST